MEGSVTNSIFQGKRILVTGGTGSFGHFITKELIAFHPAEIRVFSRDEKKQDDMRREFENQVNVTLVIGDVRDANAVRKAVRDIDLIFHAAALKQVPSCEYHVHEAVLTNIIGPQNIIAAAIEEEVDKVIAISTDKAVKPVNTMGMTKALQERLFITANMWKGSKKTVFACARYGNVIGSRGSVIPLYKEQIEAGGPVTITDGNMTRFILPLSEAIQLVFQAINQCVGGEIYVPKIPAIKIKTLADLMIEKLGEGKKIEIKDIGIRPGEKIHEVLISEEERFRTIDNGDSYVILPNIQLPGVWDNYRDRKRVDGEFFEYCSEDAEKYTKKQLVEILVKEGIFPA